MGFQVMPDAVAIFHASVRITLGDGSRVLFWVDAWIGGVTVDAIAPDLLKLVRPGIRQTRRVQQGMLDASWVCGISGELSVNAIVQFLKLWTMLRDTVTGTGDDHFAWKWTPDGRFSSRTSYQAFFFGRTALPGVVQVWQSFAPSRCNFMLGSPCGSAAGRLTVLPGAVSLRTSYASFAMPRARPSTISPCSASLRERFGPLLASASASPWHCQPCTSHCRIGGRA
jgi:hypothetical protein